MGQGVIDCPWWHDQLVDLGTVITTLDKQWPDRQTRIGLYDLPIFLADHLQIRSITLAEKRSYRNV